MITMEISLRVYYALSIAAIEYLIFDCNAIKVLKDGRRDAVVLLEFSRKQEAMLFKLAWL